MKFKYLFCLFVWSLGAICLHAQDAVKKEKGTTEKRNLDRNSPSLDEKMIIPVALTGMALIITDSDLERNWQPKVNRNLSTNIDDYTRFAPIAGMYLADGFGIQAENHWFDQTKNATFSILFTQLITTGLKRAIDKERPNGANYEAFPSGHTSLAFASATVFYEEFKNTEPLLAYSGYAFAITTAYLRMAKNKHWFSDVIIGSAVGMAVTKLVYHFDYLFTWNPFKKNEKLVVAPNFNHNGSGVYVALRF
ncbi:MAG: phosphatase PAP2 family protein [Flavobacteriaceae bacterium]